ncbi:MAG: hypothetical protein PHV59_06560 [Victivallales bacterium]|nr:hypothetical protein [Victivallales bacterium]
MKKSFILCSLFLLPVLWSGCRGTGILLMPSADDAVNEKYRRSPVYLGGRWTGNYNKSGIEADARAGDAKNQDLDLTVRICDKDKKQRLIPVKAIAFAVKDDNYVLFGADAGQLIKQGNYHPMSGGLLYPVMKIFKIQVRDADTLEVYEVIFTKNADKDKIVKLDPSMKIWGVNSNTLYGTSTEILGFLEKGAFRLSDAIVLKKVK